LNICTVYEYTITSFIHAVYRSVTESETLHRLQSGRGTSVYFMDIYFTYGRYMMK